MRMLRVEGGRRLCGQARVARAKNAVLPILAASLLTDDTLLVEDAPRIDDVAHMLEILRTLGCRAEHGAHGVALDASSLRDTALPDALAKTLRSSIFLMGPLLGRMRRAAVTYPGGCEIGLRPIDLHLQGLRHRAGGHSLGLPRKLVNRQQVSKMCTGQIHRCLPCAYQVLRAQAELSPPVPEADRFAYRCSSEQPQWTHWLQSPEQPPLL